MILVPVRSDGVVWIEVFNGIVSGRQQSIPAPVIGSAASSGSGIGNSRSTGTVMGGTTIASVQTGTNSARILDTGTGTSTGTGEASVSGTRTSARPNRASTDDGPELADGDAGSKEDSMEEDLLDL